MKKHTTRGTTQIASRMPLTDSSKSSALTQQYGKALLAKNAFFLSAQKLPTIAVRPLMARTNRHFSVGSAQRSSSSTPLYINIVVV